MKMIIDFFTGKEIKDDSKCNNCKYNQGYKTNNPSIICCDKHITYKQENYECSDYKFRCEGGTKE
ncbi:MAG: hypothetical protein HFJ53_02120 [Clostridia bacterium]|nr:hypothetical protein [Clostridia bacterium]